MVVDGLTIMDTIKEIEKISNNLMLMYPDITTAREEEEQALKKDIKADIIGLKYISYILTREALSHAD